MKRRHRRVLFNVFAFSLLGIAVYLNMYRMNSKTEYSYVNQNKSLTKETAKTGSPSKITSKEN